MLHSFAFDVLARRLKSQFLLSVLSAPSLTRQLYQLHLGWLWILQWLLLAQFRRVHFLAFGFRSLPCRRMHLKPNVLACEAHIWRIKDVELHVFARYGFIVDWVHIGHAIVREHLGTKFLLHLLLRIDHLEAVL